VVGMARVQLFLDLLVCGAEDWGVAAPTLSLVALDTPTLTYPLSCLIGPSWDRSLQGAKLFLPGLFSRIFFLSYGLRVSDQGKVVNKFLWYRGGNISQQSSRCPFVFIPIPPPLVHIRGATLFL